MDEEEGARGGTTGSLRSLKVVHCPVNFAGIGWTNVQALRRKGVAFPVRTDRIATQTFGIRRRAHGANENNPTSERKSP